MGPQHRLVSDNARRGMEKLRAVFAINICCCYVAATHTHEQQSNNEQNKRVAFAKNTAAVTLKFIWHIIFLHPTNIKIFQKHLDKYFILYYNYI